MRDVLTLILAGGKGTRLEPLTRDRAKPAVPFGGLYRIIDFTLSNCINSNLRKVLVLTQFKSRSLDRHLRSGWNFLSAELGEYVEVLPPQQRIDETWYKGTADAIYQNIYSIEREEVARLLLLDGVDVLVDGVGGALIPVLVNALLGRQHVHVLAQLGAEEAPAGTEVAVEATG